MVKFWEHGKVDTSMITSQPSVCTKSGTERVRADRVTIHPVATNLTLKGDTDMSRKHFRLVADGFLRIEDVKARRIAAETFASVAASINPAFNRSLFMTACGL